MVRPTMKQRIDPRHRHAAIALKFGTAALQAGQVDVGLEHVLLGGLGHFVLALGDLAELSEQRGRGAIDFLLPHRLVVVGQGDLGGRGQLQAGVAQRVAGGIRFRAGRRAPAAPACRPRGPSATLPPSSRHSVPGPRRRGIPRSRTSDRPRRSPARALGRRPPGGIGSLQRRVAGLDFRHQARDRQFALTGKGIGVEGGGRRAEGGRNRQRRGRGCKHHRVARPRRAGRRDAAQESAWEQAPEGQSDPAAC